MTDALGNTFTDTVLVEVGTLTVQNVFLSPPAADTTSVHAGAVLNAWAGTPDPGQQVADGFTDPIYPRNVIITLVDTNNSVTGGTARLTGTDARGQSRSEVIAISDTGGGGSSTNTGAAPFATITRLDLYSFAGLDGDEQVTLGVGTQFGLTGVLEAAADVLYVHEHQGGVVISGGYAVDVTGGQQGITFTSAPDGTRDYVVVFRTR